MLQFRDCLTHVMEDLAPIEAVKEAQWYEDDDNSRTRVTHKQRLIYIALGNSAKTASINEFEESDIEL